MKPSIEFQSTIQYTGFQTLSTWYTHLSKIYMYIRNLLYCNFEMYTSIGKNEQTGIATEGYLGIPDTLIQAQPLINYRREIN